ncbi:hypothetical protein HDV00_009048 [Rhizophlyctis rosea]|nr:hypothetical protein HDV00_009048 [Rhizophlyctis rosea]
MAARFNYVKVLQGYLHTHPLPLCGALSAEALRAIFVAARKGYIEIVRLLCGRGGKDNVTGVFPLLSASDEGEPMRGEYGLGGIRAASAYGHAEVVRYLLEHQTYIPRVLEAACTEAIVNERQDVVEIFVNRTSFRFPSYALKKAVETANVGIVRTVLNGGIGLVDKNKAYRRAKDLRKKNIRHLIPKFSAILVALEEAGGKPGATPPNPRKRKRE